MGHEGGHPVVTLLGEKVVGPSNYKGAAEDYSSGHELEY